MIFKDERFDSLLIKICQLLFSVCLMLWHQLQLGFTINSEPGSKVDTLNTQKTPFSLYSRSTHIIYIASLFSPATEVPVEIEFVVAVNTKFGAVLS